MKSIVCSVVLALILASLAPFALGAPDNTPATRKVEQARKLIAAKPQDAQGYSELALALHAAPAKPPTRRITPKRRKRSTRR